MLTLDRRRFLAGSATLAAMASISAAAFAKSETIEREAGVKLKLGLNAYSFPVIPMHPPMNTSTT